MQRCFSGSGGAKHAVYILRTSNAVKSHDTTQTSAVGDASDSLHVRFWVKSCVWRTQKPFAAAESFVTLNTGSHRATLHSLRGWCLEYLTTVVCLLSLLMSWGSLHRNKNAGPDVYRWNLSGNWSPEEWKANICLSSPGKADERCQCSP